MNPRNEALAPRKRRSAIREVRKRWPNAEVPYILDSGFPDEFKVLIDDAIQSIQTSSCVKFKEKLQEDEAWVEISRKGEDGCSGQATLGFTGAGRHNLSLETGCDHKVGPATSAPGHLSLLLVLQGVILHELLHLLGLSHEHQRPDRDTFITIHWQNINKDDVENFWRHSYQDHASEPEYGGGQYLKHISQV